jgi:PAS domain S-box-containing protein
MRAAQRELRCVAGEDMFANEEGNTGLGDRSEELTPSVVTQPSNVVYLALPDAAGDQTPSLQLALIENLHLGVLVQDGTKCVLANTQFCEMFGLGNPAQIINRSCGEAFETAMWLFVEPEAFLHGMRQLAAAGETVTGEELALVDGRTLERDYIPIQFGERRGHLWLYRNTTDRKRAERILRQSEERFRLAAKSASDLIYEWDLTTDRMRWFGDIDRRLGYNAGTFPRTRLAWEEAIHPLDLERVRAMVAQHLQKHVPYREEYRICCKDGTILFWADSGTAVWDELGHAYKWIGVHTDITERKRAEEEARTARAELETRVASRTAELSHANELLRQEIGERRRAEQERETLIEELQDALVRIKTLKGLIPICASCKKIRTDKGFWQQIEEYIGDHSDAEFSHGLCPDCARTLYPAYFPEDQ